MVRQRLECDRGATFGATVRTGTEIVATDETKIIPEAIAMATKTAEPEKRENEAEREDKPMRNGNRVGSEVYIARARYYRGAWPCY